MVTLYLLLDADGNIIDRSAEPLGDGAVEVEVPPDHPVIAGFEGWRYVEGRFIEPEEPKKVGVWIGLDPDGYVTGTSSSSLGPDSVRVEVPPDHNVLKNFEAWQYVDGELLKPEGREEQLKAEAEALLDPADLLDPREAAQEIKALKERLRNAEQTSVGIMGMLMGGGPNLSVKGGAK